MGDHPRDYLLLAINGHSCRIDGADRLLSLSDYLRKRRRLIGSKIVCSEGDCGACTVLVGRPGETGKPWNYLPIDSCIAWMFQLDGAHVVTVEGLAEQGQLNRVQQAMVECHGSQCGFCTPGFVVQMTALCQQPTAPTVDDLRQGLSGNLCRCTGYVPIFDAGLAAADATEPSIAERYPAPLAVDPPRETVSNGSTGNASEAETAILIVDDHDDTVSHRVYGPTSLPSALAFLDKHPDARIVAGTTDLGVQFNKSHQLPPVMLDLSRVEELRGIRIENEQLIAGARASWTDLLPIFQDRVPEFYEILCRFGSPQIRHQATLGGNLANASPIADSLPFLYVMEASVQLARRDATRVVPITQFYRGYKQLDMAPGELIAEATIPLPQPDDRLRLYKISRRRDLDIASFTAAIRLRVESNQIVDAKIAFGAVGPTVTRADATEQFLIGRSFSEATFVEAGKVAVAEVSPISDVRGTADYRQHLTRNILQKFYYQESEQRP